MFRINPNRFGTVSHFYQLVVGTLPKSKFPDTSQGPALQAGCKDISLRTVVLAVFCTLPTASYDHSNDTSRNQGNDPGVLDPVGSCEMDLG